MDEDPERSPASPWLDAGEYARWRETADDELRAARHAADGGFHSKAVLGAEQAAQCALKALLYGVGETDRARGHELPVLATACVELADVAIDDDLLAALTDLAREYLPSRYPDALPGGTPHGYYGLRDSQRAFAIAQAALDVVDDAWARLTAPAVDGGRGADGERGDREATDDGVTDDGVRGVGGPP